jgi:hypothetical protein
MSFLTKRVYVRSVAHEQRTTSRADHWAAFLIELE